MTTSTDGLNNNDSAMEILCERLTNIGFAPASVEDKPHVRRDIMVKRGAFRMSIREALRHECQDLLALSDEVIAETVENLLPIAIGMTPQQAANLLVQDLEILARNLASESVKIQPELIPMELQVT